MKKSGFEVAVDWSTKRGCGYTINGIDVEFVKGIEEVFMLPGFRRCNSGTVYIEATYESFDLQHRQRIEQLAADKNIVIKGIHTRLVNNWRRKNKKQDGVWYRGFKIPESDNIDTIAIWDLAHNGTSFMDMPHDPPDKKFVARAQKANKELMQLRQAGAKDDFAESFLARLPGIASVPKWARDTVLDGNGKHYNLCMLAAVVKAKEHSNGRSDFERIIGLHGNGHKCLMRSDLMHHGWNRAQKAGITLSQYRKSIRWLYHQL